MQWLKALEKLEPLLGGDPAHPDTAAAQALATVTPLLLSPAATQQQKDAHLGQIFALLLSSEKL